MRVAYIVGHYPAVSHTFVWREIQVLRAHGVDVRTISIHSTPQEQLLTEADREAARTTFAVLPIGVLRLLLAHALVLLTRPHAYFATLFRSLGSAPVGLRSRLWALFYFAEAVVVYRHCRRSGVRHLHAQFLDVATDVAMLVAALGGDGWSWSLAIHGPVEFHDVTRQRLAAKVHDAALVQTISHFGRSQVLAHAAEEDWDKVHVVRCGIDPTVYAADPIAQPESDGFRILFVGRLVQLKGPSLLLEAVAALVARGVDAHAEFVGDGPLRSSLVEAAERLGITGRVEFAGSVGQDAIRARYAAAHVFCLPSFAEGLPVVLMEAMAVGRPVVSTRTMGIPELVEDGVNGLLVPPATLEPLVDALHTLAQDPQRRRSMGESGRRKVLEEFDVNRGAPKLAELFAMHSG